MGLDGCVGFALAIAPALSAQTVDEIIAKNISGPRRIGKDQSRKTIRVTGKLTQGGFPRQLRSGEPAAQQRPRRIPDPGHGQIQAFDGQIGWHVSPFEGRKDPDLMSADDMKGLVTGRRYRRPTGGL